MYTKIKICGLMRYEDIDAVNIAQPDYIGFVFANHRLKISISQADDLRKKLSLDIVPVGVFVNDTIKNIVSLVNTGIIDAVQLHGDETEDYVKALKSVINKPIIRAITVLQTGDVQKYDTCADFILLDSKGGATGKSFDWNLIGDVRRKFFLAGGLNCENIQSAISRVSPYAVDISTGVETNGIKNKEKILTIVRRIKNGN